MTEDCIIWTGTVHREGYGRVGHDRYAHRVAYEEAFGPIPTGFIVHHACETKLCVNPDHLLALDRSAHMHEHERMLERQRVLEVVS